MKTQERFLPIEKVKKGELICKVGGKKNFIVDGYCRYSKKYAITPYSTDGETQYIKKGTIVDTFGSDYADKVEEAKQEAREAKEEVKAIAKQEAKEVKQVAEKLDVLHTALCDGLSYFCGYGFEIDYNKEQYNEAKEKLNNPCFEDVLIQILKDGNDITFVDVENDGDETSVLNLASFLDRYSLVPKDTIKALKDGDYDAIEADDFLQYILFSEITFG